METLTLPNGTQIEVPEGLSEEEKQKIINNIDNYNANTAKPSTSLDDVAV